MNALIADDLKDKARPVADLILLPSQSRQGDIGAIAMSLERHGQQKPIVVNKDNVILAGNHMFQAAVLLGWDHIAATTSDLEGQDQNSYILADNRTSDLATNDDAMLLEELKGIDDLAGTGYDGDDRDYVEFMLNKELDFVETGSPERRQHENIDLPGMTCPHCGKTIDLLG